MEKIYKGTEILITGGAGAIGSRVANRLLGYGAKVIILDDFSSGRETNIPDGADFYRFDISQGLESLEFQVDYIIHCAAFFANQNSVLFPQRDLEVNGKGTLNVLEWATKQKNLKSMVYLSTSCVYGPLSGYLEEDHLSGILETPYAITKYTGESYCKFFAQYHKLPVKNVRLFNSYGSNEYPGKFRNVIPNFFDTSMKGLPLRITGTGKETRDFTFVEDIIDGILLALSSEFSGEVFNLGTGRQTAIEDLAKLVNSITGNEAGIEYLPKRSWDNITDRCASIQKAKSKLGYDPKINLEKGLDKTYDWFKTWWRKDG